MTLKEACLQCTEFHLLAGLLKEKMERDAFKSTTNYETLKIKYEYLTELVTTIANETLEENTDE